MVKKSAKNFHVKVAVRVRPLLGHDRRQQAAVEIDTARGEVLGLAEQVAEACHRWF